MSAIKERPILFSAPMVRAILDGRKTQTRRIVNPQPFAGKSDEAMRARFIELGALGRDESLTALLNGARNAGFIDVKCPYGKPGDRLWVRETWRHTASTLDEARALTEDIMSGTAVDWRATYSESCIKNLGFSQEDAEIADSFEKWRPSIYMPRWASRITLEIEAVRVERLQNITEDDAWAEGVAMSGVCYGKKILPSTATGIERYAALWDSINGDGAWDKNPWVWVVEFKRVAA